MPLQVLECILAGVRYNGECMARIKNEVLLRKVSENAMLVPTKQDLANLSFHILGMGLAANRKIIGEYLNRTENAELQDEPEDEGMVFEAKMQAQMFKHREQDIVIKAVNSTMQISKAINSMIIAEDSKNDGIEDDLQL